MAGSIVGQQVETSFDKGHQHVHLADDPFMVVMVPLVFLINGLTKARLERGVLLRPGGGRGPDARDAADDRHGLPVQGRHRDVAQEGDRQAPELDPELRRDGRALHRQDRHAHMDRVILERHCDVVREEDDGVLVVALPQQPLPDRA